MPTVIPTAKYVDLKTAAGTGKDYQKIVSLTVFVTFKSFSSKRILDFIFIFFVFFLSSFIVYYFTPAVGSIQRKECAVLSLQ